jgi:hypothetical protein
MKLHGNGSIIHCVSALVALSLSATAFAGSPVTVTVDATSPGAAIPPDFAGISMETQSMLPDASGKYTFSPDNKPLIAMIKFMGIKCLRIGGNTSDNAKVKVPGEADIDSLFAFANAADVKVIYGLRLRLDPKTTQGADAPTTEQAYAALARNDGAIAKYIMDHYRDRLICFELGNEPNVYIKPYSNYKSILGQFIATVKSPEYAPDALICGPNAITGKGDWARDMASDFGKTGQICMITQHSYPGGSGRRVTEPSVGRDMMLSTKWVDGYQKMHDSFVPAVVENKLPYRIEETNSFFNGGAKDVSDTHASALWGLDYLYWWASHGAVGINFHTGDEVAAGAQPTRCWYALYWESAHGYHVHPLGYAVKAFDLASHGRLVPVTLSSKDDLNLRAYAVLGNDQHLYITLINKEHDAAVRTAAVSVNPTGFGRAEMMRLDSPGNYAGATGGEMLGGAEIKDDASWDGKWTPVDAAQFDVPATSAAVLRLSAL